MKWILLVFGLALSAVLVYIDAEFGRKMGVGEDAWIWAFGFGALTIASLGGLTVAARMGRYRKYGWCVGAVLIGLGCAAISLSNGMGAVAGRMNKAQAERAKDNKKAGDDQKELTAAQTEREALSRKGFNRATEETVRAATVLVANAGTARYNECKNGRGPTCIEREKEETKANADKNKAVQNKNDTDRADKLDNEIIPNLKKTVANDGLVLRENGQGAAIASLLGYPETDADWVMARQNFLMAAFWAILAAFCLGAFETMDAHEKDAQGRLRTEEVSTIEAATAVRLVPSDNVVRLPRKTLQIAAKPDVLENVTVVMADILEPDSGKVQREAVYAAYAQGCEDRGWTPVSEVEFFAAWKKLCKDLRIRVENSQQGVFYKGIALGGKKSA